jgi:hypothetical protein
MTPAEIEAAIEAFELLEPPIQQAVASLIHKLQSKKMTAQDYLDLAATLVPQSN